MGLQKKTTHDKNKEHAGWDEDDVMLFFWGNSKAAKERHIKKQEESTAYGTVEGKCG
jgi:hypothetical protein